MTAQRTHSIVMLVAATSLATGCSSFGKAPEPTPPAPARPVEVAASPPSAPTPPPRDTGVDRQVADLQLRLLEKDAQVDELQARLDDARRDVVRAMAKLQSLATRAEAASGIAEAELAVQSLPASAAPESAAEVRQLMTTSSAEFDKANYGGALYLANQAKSAAATTRGHLTTAEQGSSQPGERTLVLPLTLETSTGVNVRQGPGTTFPVLFTLPPSAQVVAYSAAEQWLRIADGTGRRGWISQGLIRERP